jgi:hypothetical protein
MESLTRFVSGGKLSQRNILRCLLDAVVIQCCSTKRTNARTFVTHNGQVVKFVAHPEQCRTAGNIIHARPDDHNPDTGITWRQHLIEYNRNPDNPLELLQAASLYKPKVYQHLAASILWKTYILSAGWGIVRSDYLLPTYDITFSASSDDYKRRKKDDDYDDFNHLEMEQHETIYFFGGTDYLPLYYMMTQNLPGRKIIYYRSKHLEKHSGYKFIRYRRKLMTNWHYDCAINFIEGRHRR